MTEQQGAFDNWEQQAQLQLSKQPQQQTQIQNKLIQQIPKEQIVQKKKIQIDPRKIFLDKIQFYKNLQQNQFQNYLEANKASITTKQIKTFNQIMKNDKDFQKFARGVGDRLRQKQQTDNAQSLQQGQITDFVEQILLLLYNKLEWKNMQEVKEKLKRIKKEKKQEQSQSKKKQQKQQRIKKAAKQQKSEKIIKVQKQQKKQQDLFGGASQVNSKQKQDQLKKGIKPAQFIKPPQQDDDDFM